MTFIYELVHRLTVKSACVCSIVRLSYIIGLFLSHDKVYSNWLSRIWQYPEVTCGIIVACVPVWPRFFRGIKETKAISKIGCLLKWFFSHFPFTSQGGSAKHSIGNRKSMYGAGGNDKLPNSQRLDCDPLKALTKAFDEDNYHRPGIHIIQTFDVETQCGPESRG